MSVGRILAGFAILVTIGALFAGASRPFSVKGDNFITAQTSGILLIEGGECFTNPTYTRHAGEVVVLYSECEDADNQSYSFVHAPDATWNRRALSELAWTSCEQDFTRMWGNRDDLRFYPILPTEETWADGDRDIMCAVYNPRGKLAESAVPLAR